METQLLTTTKACRPSLQYLEAPITSMARIAPVQPHTLAPQRCRHLLAWPPLQSAALQLMPWRLLHWISGAENQTRLTCEWPPH